METVVLLFTVLLAVSAAIVVMVIISMRKRLRRVEEGEQHRKAEKEAQERAEKERQQLEEERRKAEEKRQRLEDEAHQKAREEEQKRLADELQKVEKKRKRIEEEKRRKAQEEERRKAKKEAQGRAEKEKLEQLELERQQREEERRKTENGRRESEEERKNVEEEAQQKTEETHGGERRPPHKRGGRARGSTKRSEVEQALESKLRSPKPEIVCWNEGWKWIVGMEVPEELEILSIAQNEELLEQDNRDESRYRLNHAEGTVRVTWTEGEKRIPLAEPERNYLIFKMRKDWKGLGRLVRRPTNGYYLAIVPQEWKRDEEVSDSVSVNPESVQLDGYETHFFYQEQNSNTVIGFITANGERIQVESESPRFQLVGRKIGDTPEYMGTLFGEQLPRIRMVDEKGWSNVGVIVVGEEGSGRNRRRTYFVPQVGAEEQIIPEEIANLRGGWFFVRIYDNDDNLLESMDFRFLTALNDIHMESCDFLPGPKGYANVTVQFLHQTDCKAELMDEDIQHPLEIRRESGQTIVTVPPEPDCDKTHWILRDHDTEVEVTILVERIWWAFGVMGMTPTDWVDEPITLSRKDFTAITDKAPWLRLPRLRFVRRIDVGFDRTKSRSYQVDVEKKELAVPLRDFCDAKEIENRQEESGIMIWVQPEGAKIDEIVVIKVPAEQPPSVEPKRRQVQKIIIKEEKAYLLQATVKCRRGERKGKGFSRNEIIEAGITMKNLKCFHIPYDKRRKTSHSWNVESLHHTMRGDKHG